MEALERQCHDNMNHAIETVEGLGIEYDEDVICDVCRSPDSEEGNDMVFCDKCNICVHQVDIFCVESIYQTLTVPVTCVSLCKFTWSQYVPVLPAGLLWYCQSACWKLAV